MNIHFTDQYPYPIKIKFSLIVILIGAILVFNLAPKINIEGESQFIPIDSEVISIDLIEITMQEASVPPPPRPRVPVPVTQPVIIEDPELDQLFDIEQTLNSIPLPSRRNGMGEVVRNPQRVPRVQRIVEPISPSNPTIQDIRAEITAELTIDTSGRVTDVEIIEVRVYDRRTRGFVITNNIDEYFINSTISAAMQWQFRAAMQDGELVPSISTHVFTFGSGIN
jgi:hypothetical protein